MNALVLDRCLLGMAGWLPTPAPDEGLPARRRPILGAIDASVRTRYGFGMRTGARVAVALLLVHTACGRHEPDPARPVSKSAPVTAAASGPATSASATAAAAPSAVAAASAAASATSGAPPPEPRTLRFAWRPPGGAVGVYAMREAEDQHRIVLTRGVVKGGQYPAVIAFHGQPRRGQAPRDYAFPRTVTGVTLELVEGGEVEPLVLVVPVFRFQGENWPQFDLSRFSAEVVRVLASEGIAISRTLLFGHSGAAGCGGDGMNRAHAIRPAAVGFFDTCVGRGFGWEVRALLRERIPTLIVHSVETAGYRPRQVTEYLSTFDFGKVYAPLGLRPDPQCPRHALGVPLRDQAYSCATDPARIARAFVVNTGEGQQAHDAVVPVALRYFLREYASAVK